MTTNKVCGKGKCKFTDEFCMSGDCPYDTENVANNVAQRNSQDSERVAEENRELKELLKECNLLLIKQQANDEVEHKESAELVLRIDEVLK